MFQLLGNNKTLYIDGCLVTVVMETLILCDMSILSLFLFLKRRNDCFSVTVGAQD